ncbi:MAG: SGNH/GDSL hydrolase family protein [Cellulomonadaceae bacterium]|jgi:lysophospholipase L1-like esterase|nr:SGNH/GDSL hydrolase family protein [Cellulomonadaceae bacterium]
MDTFLKPGNTVLFQGDSVTDCERNRRTGDLGIGYASMVARRFTQLFPKVNITWTNRGVSGDRSVDVLNRYEQDIRAVKPDLISLLIGINDTWRRYDEGNLMSAQRFEEHYREILTRISSDFPACRILMMEPFLLNSLPDRAQWREDLDPKIQVVRNLAQEFADFYIPLDGLFAQATVEGFTSAQLAEDGVHPTRAGHSLIAEAYFQKLVQR